MELEKSKRLYNKFSFKKILEREKVKEENIKSQTVVEAFFHF